MPCKFFSVYLADFRDFLRILYVLKKEQVRVRVKNGAHRHIYFDDVRSELPFPIKSKL